jgi:hypothetical protein
MSNILERILAEPRPDRRLDSQRIEAGVLWSRHAFADLHAAQNIPDPRRRASFRDEGIGG